MANKTFLSSAILLFLGLAGFTACTSVDEQRQQMHGTIDSASNLAGEIINWRASVRGEVPASVADSINGFQSRASTMHSTLNGLSKEATSGKDLTALKNALQTMEDFDTSRIENSSATARASMLDQFQGLAANLQMAVARVRQS